ncbi:aminotransferase-like domain-containing protein [Pannonibacter sp. Q-1]
MTNWLPDLPSGKGPLYVRLAQRIADDIVSGALPAGAKLPPQRDLAYDLGVTVGTVGRAYGIVRERGLVSGEVGRGTYVLAGGAAPEAASPVNGSASPALSYTLEEKPVAAPASTPAWTHLAMANPDASFGGTRHAVAPAGALRLDSTSAPEVGQAQAIEQIISGIAREMPYEIASYTRMVPDSWRLAGQQWLARCGWTPASETIVPTTGARGGLMAIINATTMPGDRVIFEELTYSSIVRGITLTGRQAVAVARDDEGPIPEDLARLCAQQHPRAIFLMPTVHNPTLGQMSTARQAEIIAIAREHNLWIIEDEVYGSLHAGGILPFAELAPERTFHVGSLSKSVSAGIRGGWIASPPSHAQRLFTAHNMLTGGLCFLMAELAARLVLSGTADDLRQRILQELAARHEITQGLLAGQTFNASPQTPFIWLKLPEPWMSGTFKTAAAAQGVLVDDEDEFKTGRSARVYHRVRLGTSNTHTREELIKGLGIIRDLLRNASTGYDSFE